MTKKIGGEDIGIIGLGVMGLNLALNISDKGFTVIGYDLILTEDRNKKKERIKKCERAPLKKER